MTQGICDHCGTVLNALTRWPDDIDCPCLCHIRRREDRIKAQQQGKKKKKKNG